MDIKTVENYCEHLLPCFWCNKYDRYCQSYRDYLDEISKLYQMFHPEEKKSN